MKTVSYAFLVWAIALFSQGALAQAPDTAWTRTYQLPSHQVASDVCIGKGGYYIVGASMQASEQNWDIYLSKIDYIGNLLWARSYGDGGARYEVGASIRPTSDHGLIITGTAESDNGQMNVFLLKTNEFGDSLWMRSYDALYDFGFTVREAPDRGFIISGRGYLNGGYDALIIKTDIIGNLEWRRLFGLSNDEEGFGVCPVSTGGYALVGYDQMHPGHMPGWLVRINDNGDSLWSREYERGVCDLRWVEETSDGGFIMVGRSATGAEPETFEVYLVKTNSNGDTLWTRTFGGSDWDGGNSVMPTTDGGYIIGAYSFSFGANVCPYFIKTDSLGNLLWQKAVGTDNWNWGMADIECPDGGYLTVADQYISDQYGYDVYVVKLLPDSHRNSVEDLSSPGSFSLPHNYPNPFNAQTTIIYSLTKAGPVTLSIYNIMGQKVATLVDERQNAGEHKAVWDAGDFTSGIYLARITEGSGSRNIKMILLK
jgi:hypothetical protein